MSWKFLEVFPGSIQCRILRKHSQGISPPPSRPECGRVHLSSSLGMKFLVSELDLQRGGKPPRLTSSAISFQGALWEFGDLVSFTGVNRWLALLQRHWEHPLKEVQEKQEMYAYPTEGKGPLSRPRLRHTRLAAPPFISSAPK